MRVVSLLNTRTCSLFRLSRYPSYSIRMIPVAGEFSRGVALEIGASHFSNDSLLFFCDVDVVFNANFLRKCRSNTVRGESVYYPVLFSEFDPSHGSANEDFSEREDHYMVRFDASVKYSCHFPFELHRVLRW